MESSKLLLIERVLVLKGVSIFSETPETFLAEIAHLVEEVEKERGELIFSEGETGDSLFVIFRGSVRIHKGEQTIATFHEKDFFGELAILDTEKRSASASALTDCLLLKLDQEPLFDLLETRPEVVQGILKVLCSRIRTMNEKMMEKD